MERIFGETLSNTHLILLVVALTIVCGFEIVNGFHDTANAVATVIYTRSLKPWLAVIWSGFWNFLGVYVGGTAVAFSIVHLLPVDLVVNIGTGNGLAMVLALLVGAGPVTSTGSVRSLSDVEACAEPCRSGPVIARLMQSGEAVWR